MMKSLKKIEKRFNKNLDTTDELISFDRIILDLCINHIESLNERLKEGPWGKITNPSFLADGTLSSLKLIRQNDSLRQNYQSIFNSCLVLQISYFTSTLNDIFRYTFSSLALSNQLPEIKDSVKFSLKELSDLSFNLTKDIGNLVLKKRNISFQDMQSTVRTFNDYFDIKIEKDEISNTIILAQASRHAIVHSLGIADEKFITQISNTTPRNIEKEFKLKDEINYSPDELEIIKNNMLSFITSLCEQIKVKYALK